MFDIILSNYSNDKSFYSRLFEGQVFFIGMDWKIVLTVFMLCTLLVFISQCPPLLYILKMNTVAALKE